ncbi:MAG: hypothetical protein PVF83_14455 [Anaerolineales bacterium]|jgi:hypothetical protein
MEPFGQWEGLHSRSLKKMRCAVYIIPEHPFYIKDELLISFAHPLSRVANAKHFQQTRGAFPRLPDDL